MIYRMGSCVRWLNLLSGDMIDEELKDVIRKRASMIRCERCTNWVHVVDGST